MDQWTERKKIIRKFYNLKNLYNCYFDGKLIMFDYFDVEDVYKIVKVRKQWFNIYLNDKSWLTIRALGKPKKLNGVGEIIIKWSEIFR